MRLRDVLKSMQNSGTHVRKPGAWQHIQRANGKQCKTGAHRDGAPNCLLTAGFSDTLLIGKVRSTSASGCKLSRGEPPLSAKTGRMHCSKDDGRLLAGYHRKLRIAKFTVSTYGRISTGAAGSLLRSSRQSRGDCGERQGERERDLCHHGRSP